MDRFIPERGVFGGSYRVNVHNFGEMSSKLQGVPLLADLTRYEGFD
jgi:hypothetical protein